MAQQFYELSDGADRIQTYRVELPSTWRNTECTAHLPTATEGRVDHPDVLVGGRHPLWGDKAHAHQFGGCGFRGNALELPFALLTDGIDIGEEQLNRSLVEAARWRYGVFAEHGFPGDSRYPAVETLPGAEEEVTLVDNSGCDVTERLNGGGLCPLTAAYRVEANTKQNLLCRERSARQTILDKFSQQKEKHTVRPFSKPNHIYLLPADTERMILLLEQSSTMESAWSAVLAATFHFINSLEEGTELAIVIYSAMAARGAAVVHLEPTRVVGGNREGLHYRIPRRLAPSSSADNDGGEEPACLACGLAAAGQLATNTTTLIIFSSSSISSSSKNNSSFMTGSLPWNVPGVARPTMRHIILQSNASDTSASSGGSFNYLVDGKVGAFPGTASWISSALASSIHAHPGRKFHQER
jgi:hypothetical protein